VQHHVLFPGVIIVGNLKGLLCTLLFVKTWKLCSMKHAFGTNQALDTRSLSSTNSAVTSTAVSFHGVSPVKIPVDEQVFFNSDFPDETATEHPHVFSEYSNTSRAPPD
jgi:hypothetical protein